MTNYMKATNFGFMKSRRIEKTIDETVTFTYLVDDPYGCHRNAYDFVIDLGSKQLEEIIMCVLPTNIILLRGKPYDSWARSPVSIIASITKLNVVPSCNRNFYVLLTNQNEKLVSLISVYDT